MSNRLRQWVLQYQFLVMDSKTNQLTEVYPSESAWRADFDKFCAEFRRERAKD